MERFITLVIMHLRRGLTGKRPAIGLALTIVLAAALCFAPGLDVLAQKVAPGCKAPDAVCQASKRVYPMSSYLPAASAIEIEPGVLVTNRHVVGDQQTAFIFVGEGQRRTADVVPTSYPGDLILLRLPELHGNPPAKIVPPADGAQVYTIGADIGRGAVRVYIPGRINAIPAQGKPMARIHHSARMLPSNSGGALVDRNGDLVGIIASGGEGRNEAIPAGEIAKLKDLSGPSHLQASQARGRAYRACIDQLEEHHADPSRRLDPSGVEALYRNCLETGNRQLFDDAGRVLGRQRFHDQSLDLFRRSLEQDPNGVNTRLSLAITLHVAGRFEEEIPHLDRLMTDLPADPQVLRLGIQAGKWSGNDAFADRAFELLVRHHPQLKSVAERFMNQPPPPRPGGGAPR